MKRVFVVLALIGSWLLPQLTRAQTSPEDKAAILDVVKQFEDALRTRDSVKTRSLYYGDVMWVSVIEPESLKMLKTFDATVKAIDQRGAFEMMSDPRMKNLQMEEVFVNPVIHSDGQVASATFDYGFKINGQFTNWGKEAWHLVKDNGKWKILHLVFSYNLVQVKPLPDWLKGK